MAGKVRLGWRCLHLGLKCFHQVEYLLNFIKLFQSAKQNQAQLMNSSDLSRPTALSSAKTTLEVTRRLVVWPGDIFHTVCCGPGLSRFRWQEGRAGRHLAAGEHMQMSSRWHSPLFWIPAWSRTTTRIPEQKDGHEVATTSCFLVRNKNSCGAMRCMALFGVGGNTSETVMACTGQNAVCNPVCFPSFLCKFWLETRFGMKANGCDSRRTETPVKAKWIPPLTKLQSFAFL